MNSPSASPELQRFLDLVGVEARSKVLIEVIRQKQLHRLTREQGFEILVSQMVAIAARAGEQERLRAVSFLCKIARLVRPAQDIIAPAIAQALRLPLASLQCLIDPDERYYAAAFWRFAEPEWGKQYLAAEIVAEESAESVRKELADGLFGTSPSYSHAIKLLANSLASFRFDTEHPGNSMARRVRRSMSALLNASKECGALDPGPDFGNSIRELIRAAFGHSGLPTNGKVAREAAFSVLEFITTVSRLRLALAFESETYSPLYSLRDWFSEGEWSNVCVDDVGIRFRDDIVDALEVSVRSGRLDGEFLRLLDLACSDNQEYVHQIERIVQRNLGLPEAAAAWLLGREVRAQTALSQESQLSRIETIIAQLILLNLRAESLVEEIQSDILPALLAFHSVLTTPLERLLKTIDEGSRAIRDLAIDRNLQTFGAGGEIVEFSSLEHQMLEFGSAAGRQVRIVEPGVLVIMPRGGRRVITKATVK
jgi:hypothetical protein